MNGMGEVRATAESGGQKGRKLMQQSLIPPALREQMLSAIEMSEHLRFAARMMLDFEEGLAREGDLLHGAKCLVEEVEDRWSMAEALAFLGDIYGFGANKYSRDNYLAGYPYSWTIDAFWRHLLLDVRGEELDGESGRPHLLHCAWHMLALREFVLRGVGTDDRLWVRR